MALENRRSVELLHFPPRLFADSGPGLPEVGHHGSLGHAADHQWRPARAATWLSNHYRYRPDCRAVECRQGPGRRLRLLQGLPDQHGQAGRPYIPAARHCQRLPSVHRCATGSKQQYGPTVNVLSLVTISPVDGVEVPVLGANHPSYIWYAADPASYTGRRRPGPGRCRGPESHGPGFECRMLAGRHGP